MTLSSVVGQDIPPWPTPNSGLLHDAGNELLLTELCKPGCIPPLSNRCVTSMDQESEVDLSNLAITPLWRKRRTTSKSPNTGSFNQRTRVRPASSQIDGVLVTDFPVEGSMTAPNPSNGIVVSSPKGRVLLQRQLSTQSLPAPDKPHYLLSTNSAVSLKNGTQQIIPKDLASGIRVKNLHQNSQLRPFGGRNRRVQSMLETPSAPLVPRAHADGDMDPEPDSPGQLRRGLRSTSYRRAVVSGVQFDNATNVKPSSRRSQPNLKTVVEDKEKFSTLARVKVIFN